ncbi:unnamed protein product [Rhizophagus irregularis]|nr:unnamed protein product [Rhizophagus irregularis]
MGLFTRYDELLTQDPIKYWRSLSDIRQFFSLLGLFQFLSMQTSFYAVDWLLSFNTFKQTLYSRLVIFKSFTFAQFCLKLWFNELPVMYKLSQRYPNLYADDSLCPICGIFMETLKHLFVCSPSHLDAKDDISELLNQRILPQNLLNQLRCKYKTEKDAAKGILPSALRSYKEPSVQPFRFSASQVALSQANRSLSTSEWFTLGINWLYSSLAQHCL